MWLKTWASENKPSPKNWSQALGITESCARSWFKGVVPRPEHWTGVSVMTGVEFTMVRTRYQDQLRSEDRVVQCQVCGVEVIRWVRKTLLCKSAECRRVYDLERKRVARAKIKRIGIEGPTFQRYLGPVVPEPPKDELRKTCDDAVRRYLENGGKITRLPDENAGENVLFLADLADARLQNPVSH